MKRVNLKPTVCLKCGNVFLGAHADTFCPACKSRKTSSGHSSVANSFWDVKRLKRIKRKKCVVCGKTFFADANTKVCSAECEDIRNSPDAVLNQVQPRRAGITQTDDGKWIASKMGVAIGIFETAEEAEKAVKKKQKKPE